MASVVMVVGVVFAWWEIQYVDPSGEEVLTRVLEGARPAGGRRRR